jgi:hypothetical protein
MKNILLALSFALSIPACMQTATVDSPETGVQASPLQSRPSPHDETCYEQCGELYDACTGSAATDFDLCQCFNQDIACRRRRGDHDPFIRC